MGGIFKLKCMLNYHTTKSDLICICRSESLKSEFETSSRYKLTFLISISLLKYFVIENLVLNVGIKTFWYKKKNIKFTFIIDLKACGVQIFIFNDCVQSKHI